MNIYLAPANAIQWEDNERTGYRHVGVMRDGVKLFAITSHRVDGVWTTSAIPMGYSYTKDDMVVMATLFNNQVLQLMKYIERNEEITHDDILKFVEELGCA